MEVIRRMIRDLALEVEFVCTPPFATRTASRSPRGTLCSRPRNACAHLPSRVHSRHGTPTGARALLAEANGLVVDYVEVADFDPPVLAGAVRVGSTRLIDNVPLEGDEE